MSGKGGKAEAPEQTPAQPQNPEQLTQFVQTLLLQMQSRFQEMSNTIIGRIDEMGNRIDELEKSIGELMAQAGIEDSGSNQQPPSNQ